MNSPRTLSPSLSHLALLALAALALAAVGQYAHTFLGRGLAAIALFAAGLGLWLLAVVYHPIQLETRIAETAPEMASRRRRGTSLLALGALALGVVTFLTSTDNAFTVDNVAPWVLSIAAFLYAFWEPEKSWEQWRMTVAAQWDRIRQSAANGFHVSSRVVILALIMLLGIFFYYHDLDGVPGEMDSDHAEKILDVNDAVTNGLRPIFFERNTGREPLEFYLIAALVEWGNHPIDHMALKLVTATMGLLVIPGTYLLVREILNEQVGFLAAALIAVSKWPVTIARMGLRFPFTPVFVAPMLYFLFRGLKYRRRNDFLMAGLFLGLGLYGYNAFRMAPVLLVAFVLLWPLVSRRLERAELITLGQNIVLVFAFTLIIFAPLLKYSLDHPENFWYRVLTRLSGEERPLTVNPVRTFASNARNVALMFNWTGDDAWPNSIPGDPALDYVTGGLFLFGLALAIYRIARYREQAYVFVLVGLAIMLLPSALSLAFPNENPSNARTGGAVPFVFTIAALPLAWLARSLAQNGRAFVGGLLVCVLLVVIAGINYVRYFRDFGTNYLEHSWNSSEVAGVIRGFAGSVGDFSHVWIMLYPHWIDTRNVAINMGQIGWEQTLPDVQAARAHAQDAANKLYVLNPDDVEHLAGLQELLPNGQLRVFHARTPGHDFVLWYVPGTIAPNEPLESK